jgi:hypothetical protein
MGGSKHAADLIEGLRKRYAGKPLGEFATQLLRDVEEDRLALKQVADRVGSGSAKMKETAGWLADKVSRIKLSHDKEDGLGTLEALEFLTLGILGKRALWRALALLAPHDIRLAGVDFEKLTERAELQHAATEEQRLRVAVEALTPPIH